MDKKLGFSSGERQLKSLEEIVNATHAQVYLLDEWDANLDAANKAKADALVDELAARARVVEISHRDQAASASRNARNYRVWPLPSGVQRSAHSRPEM
jgi:ABC-type transport system involved in cytochrome bd biosynthesis fused ATPase/permease subunit